jgi:hypothetical protein
VISKIHISPPEIVIQREPGKAIGKSVFKKGQVVTATVLHLLSSGKARLLIDGQTIIAKTGLLLSPGEELLLKVVQQKDIVELKLLESPQPVGTKQLVSLIRFLAKNNALPDIAGIKNPVVKDILRETALKSGKRDDSFLPRLIENNGLMWEKKMGSLVKAQGQDTLDLNLVQLQKQDLKGALLNELALASLKGDALAIPKGDALEKTVAFLETLESFQLLNTQTSESGRYLLPFPVFVGSDLSFGQLLIDTGDKKQDKNKDGHRVVRVSFLLNMTQLGAVRADFSILKKAITGRFLLENDGVCTYMKTLIPELQTRFEQLEYDIGNIDCLTAAKAEIHPNVLMESLFETGDDSVLNIVI